MDYMNLSDAEFERHFNPRATILNIDERAAAQNAKSAEVRSRYKHTADVPYGSSPNERLDIFHPNKPGAPVLLFIHGGYWRALHKDGYSYVAPPFVDAGACVVVIHYDLAPSVTLDRIVAQAIASIAWTHANIATYGGNPDRLYVAGNSAGAHMAAMALEHDFSADALPSDTIEGAALITGVMDCTPVLKTSVNADVRLDADAARRLSPIHHPPRRALPLIVAVGGGETEGWIELSRSYSNVCDAAGIGHTYMELPGHNHFDMGAAVGDRESPLTRAMLAQMGLA